MARASSASPASVNARMSEKTIIQSRQERSASGYWSSRCWTSAPVELPQRREGCALSPPDRYSPDVASRHTGARCLSTRVRRLSHGLLCDRAWSRCDTASSGLQA